MKDKFFAVLAAVFFTIGTASAAVTSFTLMNADNNTEIQTISDGDTINLQALATENLNIRANVDETPSNVSFSLSGATSRTHSEGAAPYALWGDQSGNYYAAALNVGAHTLSATPAGGDAYTINFSVVNAATGEPSVNAGDDITLTLPINSTDVNGSANDDGSIETYEWTQQSGPNTATLSGEDTATLTASGLIVGTYVMRLTATDNDNKTAFDEVRIVVWEDMSVANGTYLEKDGMVIMEMENTSSPLDLWEHQTTYSKYTGDGYLWFTGNKPLNGTPKSPLEYRFKITKPGLYYLHLHCARDTTHNQAADRSNDCYVRVDGDYGAGPNAGDANGNDAPLNILKSDTKFFGGNADSFAWASGNRLDPGGENNKRRAIYDFKAGEEYTLVIHGCSQWFSINRILFRHQSVSASAAQNLSLPESEQASGKEDGDGTITFGGDAMQWHRFDLKMAAKASSQDATPNPFMDYRFNVTFTHLNTGKQYVVPGYFAADGKGSSTNGNIWVAHLNPHKVGKWSYKVSFRSGSQVAVDLSPTAGSAVAPFDGATGTFEIYPSDKTGKDFRAPEKGMLVNRRHHYLTYGGSGKPFVYSGPGIPENILGYRGFINTTRGNHLHSFDDHLKDWNEGDPDWGDGAGKKLIGTLNFIAEHGGNALYMMSNTIDGDGNDVFPHPTPKTTKDRYDLIKLKQWDIALAYAQKIGIFLHWHLCEVEPGNRLYYGGSDADGLTPEKKLSLRMHQALFGHYNALKWNLAEETRWTTAERTAQMAYIKASDPYDHPITYQTNGGGVDERTYEEHYADPNMDGGSIQNGGNDIGTYNTMQRHRNGSAAAGNPWTCSLDEPQTIHNDLTDENLGYPNARRRKLWPTFMGGGDGFLWYIQKDGGGHGFDQDIESYEIMKTAFNWSGHVTAFMNLLPLIDMSSSLNIVDSASGIDYTLYKAGEIYAIYNDDVGENMSMDLSDYPGTYTVRWYDPRNGGELQVGTIDTITGGANHIALGSAPNNLDQDWAILVRKEIGEYADWSEGFATTPDEDEDGDGVPNLVAYAIGAEPGESARALLPKLERDGTNKVLVINHSSKTDVDYTVEISSDLIEWNPLARRPQGQSTFILSDVPDTALESIGSQMKVLDARDDRPQQFYRLRINR